MSGEDHEPDAISAVVLEPMALTCLGLAWWLLSLAHWLVLWRLGELVDRAGFVCSLDGDWMR
jgi:hypothetical protein